MHRILISVGSNIRRKHHTRAAYQALKQQFGHLCCSKVYKCKPVGFKGKSFFNWVVAAETPMSVAQVVDSLKRIEQNNGRSRQGEKYGPRTMDLDLLTYDDKVTTVPVQLPRGEILYHAFVLKPLSDLLPDEKHPICQRTYRQLWQDFDQSSQQIRPIEFAWSTKK